LDIVKRFRGFGIGFRDGLVAWAQESALS
jgi:hypothetical protein